MGLRILCYHQIEPEYATGFSDQLEYFARSGYQFLPLTEGLVNRDKKCITVSFDDGDYTLCDIAQPILDSKGIKAIVYLSSDYVLQGSIYKAKKPIKSCSWGKLGAWLEAGHEIGNHTHSHINMTKCSEAQIIEDLEQSRIVIKQHLGIEVKHFAYPWGLHNSFSRSLLARDGTWVSAATIERGINKINTDPLCLKRDLIDPWLSVDTVRMRIWLGGPIKKIRRQISKLNFGKAR